MMEKAAGAPGSQDAKDTGSGYKDYAMEAALLEAQQKRRSGGVPGTHEPFPVQLHWVLEQTEKDGLSHVVGWAPHGRAFVVYRREQFVEQVLPVYFNQTKFTSFQRQLSLYGFRRITRGPDRGGYYHPMFLRISRTFARNITRTKVKNEGPRKAASPATEPDLYSMPKLSESIDLADAKPSSIRAATRPGASLASEARDPTQLLPAARMPNSPIDAPDVRVASAAAAMQITTSPSSGLLPVPQLRHNQLLAHQLQLQHQRDTLLAPRPAMFPSLPNTLPNQVPQPNLPATASTLPSLLFRTSSSSQGAAASASVPTVMMPDLLSIQSSTANNPQRSLAATMPADRTVSLGLAQGPAPASSAALSDAIAQLMGGQFQGPAPAASLSDTIAQLRGAYSNLPPGPQNPNNDSGDSNNRRET